MAEIMLKGYRCERCNHTWVPRDESSPTVCPKCKSPYWNKPRKSESEQAHESMKLKRSRGRKV
ncbi:MAG: hypothetical protein K5777_08330 [Nitrosopumilus sp.]|nr:hypothetical protein [Nitrosopumilus sp.]